MPTCSLWPYKFVTQLLSKLVDSNAITLYTHTPVTSISTSSASSTTLHTPHGTLTTKKLIFATNAYTSSICPVYAQQIIPYKGTACHISPSHPISPHLSNTYNIYQPHPSSQPQRTDYLNPRPDSSIVLGGGKHLYAVDKESWYNSTDDSTLLPHVSTYFTSYMATHFLGWKESAARITHLWTGIQGSTPDGFPYVGKVPAGATGEATGEATGKEEWYIAAGFNGGGMTFIFQCAEGLAKMVEGKWFEETGLLGLVDARRMEGGVSR
jgi:glycine/D-amino acid oxidase-like deaminating enzyme